MDYRGALDHLDSLINYEVVPRGAIEGLKIESMEAFMGALGDPHEAYRVIHLTGTNGKGSTARMIEAILTTMGLRVGLYTSPHLGSPRERIRVGGDDIGEDDFAAAIGDVVRVEEIQGLGPRTWFDTVTSAALLHFANEAVDVAVVEVGMLGRFDSTNVVHADVAVITNVGLDHSDGGPGWRTRVAAEKVGIIEAGRPVVVGECDDELLALVRAESPSAVVAAGRDYAVMENRLRGRRSPHRRPHPRGAFEEALRRPARPHQGANAATAIAAEEFFGAALPADVVAEAFDTVRVAGRLEVVRHQPTVLIDAAHNVPGAEALARSRRTSGAVRDGSSWSGCGRPGGRRRAGPRRPVLRAREYVPGPVSAASMPRRSVPPRTSWGLASTSLADVAAAIDHAVGRGRRRPRRRRPALTSWWLPPPWRPSPRGEPASQAERPRWRDFGTENDPASAHRPWGAMLPNTTPWTSSQRHHQPGSGPGGSTGATGVGTPSSCQAILVGSLSSVWSMDARVNALLGDTRDIGQNDLDYFKVTTTTLAASSTLHHVDRRAQPARPRPPRPRRRRPPRPRPRQRPRRRRRRRPPPRRRPLPRRRRRPPAANPPPATTRTGRATTRVGVGTCTADPARSRTATA
ncbi:MAG: Mur ligase family protein [Acidimicrobiales bacterium]